MAETRYEKLNYPNSIVCYRVFTIDEEKFKMSITERYVSAKNDRIVLITKEYDKYRLKSCVLSSAVGTDDVDVGITFDYETDANLYAEMFMNGLYVYLNNSDVNES